MAYFYAEEKLSNAVHLMAIGAGSIKDRLYDAFLEIVPLSSDDFPEHLRDEYRWIREELTKKEAKQHAVIDGHIVEGVEGRIGATLRSVRIEKAQGIARRLYQLAHEVRSLNQAT